MRGKEGVSKCLDSPPPRLGMCFTRKIYLGQEINSIRVGFLFAVAQNRFSLDKLRINNYPPEAGRRTIAH